MNRMLPCLSLLLLSNHLQYCDIVLSGDSCSFVTSTLILFRFTLSSYVTFSTRISTTSSLSPTYSLMFIIVEKKTVSAFFCIIVLYYCSVTLLLCNFACDIYFLLSSLGGS